MMNDTHPGAQPMSNHGAWRSIRGHRISIWHQMCDGIRKKCLGMVKSRLDAADWSVLCTLVAGQSLASQWLGLWGYQLKGEVVEFPLNLDTCTTLYMYCPMSGSRSPNVWSLGPCITRAFHSFCKGPCDWTMMESWTDDGSAPLSRAFHDLRRIIDWFGDHLIWAPYIVEIWGGFVVFESGRERPHETEFTRYVGAEQGSLTESCGLKCRGDGGWCQTRVSRSRRFELLDYQTTEIKVFASSFVHALRKPVSWSWIKQRMSSVQRREREVGVMTTCTGIETRKDTQSFCGVFGRGYLPSDGKSSTGCLRNINKYSVSWSPMCHRVEIVYQCTAMNLLHPWHRCSEGGTEFYRRNKLHTDMIWSSTEYPDGNVINWCSGKFNK